eukprot:5200651-Ditylum_brightwellii.AAC.1
MNTIKQHMEQLRYGRDRDTNRGGRGRRCGYYGRGGQGYGGKSGKGQNDEWLIGQRNIEQIESIESAKLYCSLRPSMHSNTVLTHTGASDHYIREDAPHKENKSNLEKISVAVPNDANIQ